MNRVSETPVDNGQCVAVVVDFWLFVAVVGAVCICCGRLDVVAGAVVVVTVVVAVFDAVVRLTRSAIEVARFR